MVTPTDNPVPSAKLGSVSRALRQLASESDSLVRKRVIGEHSKSLLASEQIRNAIDAKVAVQRFKTAAGKRDANGQVSTRRSTKEPLETGY